MSVLKAANECEQTKRRKIITIFPRENETMPRSLDLGAVNAKPESVFCFQLFQESTWWWWRWRWRTMFSRAPLGSLSTHSQSSLEHCVQLSGADLRFLDVGSWAVVVGPPPPPVDMEHEETEEAELRKLVLDLDLVTFDGWGPGGGGVGCGALLVEKFSIDLQFDSWLGGFWWSWIL